MDFLRWIISIPRRLRLLESEVATLREMHIRHSAGKPALTEYPGEGIIKTVHREELREIAKERERLGIEPAPVIPAFEDTDD